MRFTNQDSETHNVHVVSPGFAFNQSMGPGQPRDFTPERAGVMRLSCDIHQHMRGYVVVSPSSWVRVCDREGRFRLAGVPDGNYVLTAWHEMGDPLRVEISVSGSQDVHVPELVLTTSPALSAGTGRRSMDRATPVRKWPEVVDRIGMILAASRDAAARPGELPRGAEAGRGRILGRVRGLRPGNGRARNTWGTRGRARSSRGFARFARECARSL